MRFALAAVLVVVALAIASAPAFRVDRGGDGVPAVGSSQVVDGAVQWPEPLRRELGLQSVNTDLVRKSCGVDVDAGADDEDLQARTDRLRVAEAMRGVLGPHSGSVWFDPCDRGRFKVGVARGARSILAPKIARARAVLRERGVGGGADLVAVASPTPAIVAAQQRVHAVPLPADDLASSWDPSGNALTVRVARDVDADGWRALRRAAGATGVTVVIERRRADSMAPQLL